jgi:adenylate kinase
MKKVIILIGAPGSGKGTQSALLKDILHISHISTGDLLRQEVAQNTLLGNKIKALVTNGILVDDETITELLDKRISQNDCEKGFILDGYPRTLNQAEILDKLFKKHNISYIKVVEILISDDILIKRILGRYTCSNCNAVYNEYFHKTKQEGICDVCSGSSFAKRNDDNLDTLEKRLKIYHDQSIPILDFYSNQGIKFSLKGDLDINESKNELVKILN